MRELAALRLEEAKLASRAEIASGDLVEPLCGLAPARLADVTHVWHLAAIYDLAVPAARAEAVNVRGTENVLDLCVRLPALERLIYFSTVVVAGRRTGVVLESELDGSAGFFNHY